jgi:hypothetical protein
VEPMELDGAELIAGAALTTLELPMEDGAAAL